MRTTRPPICLRYAAAGLTLVTGLALTGCGSSSPSGRGAGEQGPEPAPPSGEISDNMLPIVFVHGVAGSAQQYQTQAMRFVANGYPPERIRAFEYNGGLEGVVGAAAGLFTLPLLLFIDEVRAEFDVDQVYLVGHSLGTLVSFHYLLSGLVTGLLPEVLGPIGPADRVAKYIGIDGLGGNSCPGNVECLGIFDGDGMLGDNNANIEGQAHVEVATSEESFIAQYEFLLNESPRVVDIEPQEEPIEISGRAVFFPENRGFAGAALQIWEIDAETGHRTGDMPHATFEIGESGEWGPVVVEHSRHYEKTLVSDFAATIHYYFQPYLRSTHLVRLLASDNESDTAVNTHAGDDHAAVIALRMREWFSTHASGRNDVLEISTTSARHGNQPPFNVITDHIGNGNLAIHIHDAEATPGESTGEPLPFFSDQPFQAGADVYMPAADPPDGTITFRNAPRGDTSRMQVLNIPNWASSDHRSLVIFNDYVNP